MIPLYIENGWIVNGFQEKNRKFSNKEEENKILQTFIKISRKKRCRYAVPPRYRGKKTLVVSIIL